MKKFLFALFLAVTLSACSSGLLRSDGPRLDYNNYAGEPVSDIVVMRGIDSWTPVSRDQLVIWTGINEAYLLRVWNACPDLTFANSIRVTQTGYTINKFEKVIAGRDSCPILEIRPLDVKQLKADRKAAKDRDRQKP
jgi:hypothetical protein